MYVGTRMKIATAVASALVLISGCTVNQGPSSSPGDQRHTIDEGVAKTMGVLYSSVPGSRELERKATGVLVFPRVLQAGLVIGGEHGRGVLRIPGRPESYYQITGLSVGWQAGAESKALVIMFLTPAALNKFLASNGWTAGADASVAVVHAGANATLDTLSAKNDVVAFALTNAGLMAAATIDGTKITRLESL